MSTWIEQLMGSNPKNWRELAEPDASYGIVHGWCGDTSEIHLRLTGEKIKEVGLMTDRGPRKHAHHSG